MRTIALLTDFGADSFYVGAMRAVLAACGPAVPVVDVTHGIAPHAVGQAGFVLDRVFDWFPPETVFVTVVDPGVGGSRRNLVVATGGRFVVGPDNGIAGEVVARAGLERAVVIEDHRVARYRRHDPIGHTFHGRDVFAPAGAAVAMGADAGELGHDVDTIEPPSGLPPVEVGDGFVRGAGRYVDTFGNIVSNISVRDIAGAFHTRGHREIVAGIEGRGVGPLYEYYSQAPAGTLMAVVNSWNLVEISANRTRASDVFSCERVEDLSIELRAARP